MIRCSQTLFLLFPIALMPVVSAGPVYATETMTLDVCPTDYSGFPADGPALDCGCAPEATKTGSVFGANPYYWQSSICRAALHAGVLSASGGQILVTPAPTVPVYPSVTRNGIAGQSWRGGQDNVGFRLAALPGATALPAPTKAAPAPIVDAPVVDAPGPTPVEAAGTTAIDICPTDYSSFPAEGPSLACGCTPDAVKGGKVFGANPYYWQSSVCKAAAHAGLIGSSGGQIVVAPAPVAPVFPAVTRNGIVADSWRGGPENRGFQILAGEGATTTVSRVETTPTGLSVDVCPSDYGSFPAEGPSLTCGCTPGAVKGGKIFGANPYYWQSSLCQAAVHAGLVDGSGGQIVVAPAPVTPVYPAVKRHGIESDSWRGGVENRGFRVTAVPGAVRQAGPGPAPHVDNAGEPVQAPVAETLRATGQVALYVRFRFNSADLDISGAATLMQLRDALAAAPDLRLLLVGHTDAVGSRDYNRNLSLKRAEAVMLWLRDQGIPVQRLAIDGKGYDEPIADNATDSGRSLNRRVQAIRIP